MELITLKIAGHNDTVIDLAKPERKYNFVVQDSGVPLTLVDFYTRGGVRNTVLGQRESGDVVFHISEVSSEDNNISIRLGDKATSNAVVELADTYTWTGHSLLMKPLTSDLEPRDIMVSIVSPNGEVVSLKIFVASNRSIYDVVLDFGSEASQVSITRRNQEVWNVGDIMEVFTSIRDRYDQTIEPRQCTQFERAVYYKSHFFIPKRLSDKENDRDAASVFMPDFNPALVPDNARLKFLTKTVDENTPDFKERYMKLPNVKISKFSAIPLNRLYFNGVLHQISGFKDDYYYRSAINIFVHTILDYLQRVAEVPKCYISLTVLMPNVYSQSQVSLNLRYMSEDIESMLESEYGTIAGYEIQSISESDASFLGIMNTERAERKDGLYLIMDAGKGTLDSSVVRVDNQGKMLYSGLFRFGSVGAGAALSYAVLVCLADSFLTSKLNGYVSGNENQLREFIWRVILNENNGPDLADLTDLIKIVDKYKSLIGSTRLNEGVNLVARPDSMDNLNMRDFINWINSAIEQSSLVDLTRLDVQIDEIVEDAMKRLDELPNYANGINYVIFSGRGFLLKRFKERMYGRLQEKFKSIQELPCPGDMKNQCLKVVNSVRANHYDGRLVGKPYVQTSVRVSQNEHSVVLKRLSSIFGVVTRAIVEQTKDEFSILNPDGSNPLVYGFKDRLKGLGDTIRVGNYNYDVNNDIFRPGPVDLVFDGCDIWLRQRGQIGRLDTGQIGCVANPMAFASLFPDVRPDSINDIPVLTPPADRAARDTNK